MSATAVASFATLSARDLVLKDKLVFHGANDDAKKTVMKVAEPSTTGEFEYQFPAITQNVEMIHSQNISNFNGAVADNSITTAKLQDGSVTTIKVADSAITNAKLAGSIAYNKLDLNNAVQNSDLAGSIAYGKLDLANAVQNSDLAGSIAYNKLSLTGAVTNADLAGSIEKSKLQALEIGNTDVAANANIAYSKLDLSNAVQNSDLQGSIAYNKLSLTGAITNADLAGSIEKSKLQALEIADSDVAANAAIAGSKINPNFQAQNVQTTGYVRGATVRITDAWRMRVNGTDLEVQYSSDGGSTWNTKGSFSSA